MNSFKQETKNFFFFLNHISQDYRLNSVGQQTIKIYRRIKYEHTNIYPFM